MRVISKARLKQFWGLPGQHDAAGALQAWYTHVSKKAVCWNSWGNVKTEFGTASLVGNCIVFNIGGNKYRLVTRVLYPSQKVFILKVMTHKEYDADKCKDDCGCFAGPSTRSSPSAETKRKSR